MNLVADRLFFVTSKRLCAGGLACRSGMPQGHRDNLLLMLIQTKTTAHVVQVVGPRAPSSSRPIARAAALLLTLGFTSAAGAQGLGISSQGSTGGLTIPSAFVLESGTAAFSYGNYRDPAFALNDKRRNVSVGIGLVPYVEFFGRFADYSTTAPGSAVLTGGIRDLSPNIKVQIPPIWQALPNLAVGLNDFAGGAQNFRAAYGVASDQYGPVRLSLGYAKGRPVQGNVANGYAFKGFFGGAEVILGGTGLAALAEYDGQQKHVGLRYYSPALAYLGGAQIIGTVQRTLGATNRLGGDADATSYSMALVVPLGKAPPARQVADRLAKANSLPPLDAPANPSAPAMVATAQDRLDTLQRALVAVGLERVRVGTLANNLVVEYENNRYGHNESDALGIVMGLAAEQAPAGIQRAYAVTLRAGLRVYETSVDVPAYRAFLRDGDAAYVRAGMAFDRLPEYAQSAVSWSSAAPSRHSLVRIEIKPEINYALGTEVGAFDYSLAANVQGIVPLWRGAELYTSYIRRVSNSDNYEPGFAFSGSRQRNGLKVAAVQQSFWLGPQVFANVGVGRYNYDAYGVQGEASLFVPGRDDVIRLRAGAYQRQPGQTNAQRLQASGSYRWAYSPSTWLEAGLQQYSDGTRGPSFVLTRWFGDVGAHLFFRKGGNRQFAGLEISIPLTPRRGMEPGLVQFTGTPQFQRGIRTRITGGSTASNNVEPNAVRDMQLDYNAELRQLNAGRTSQRYFISQLHRMREAFYLYGRDLLPH
ncbi:MAG: YjbH domain-containing protein [Ramlibacter sp.]|nr:YjbH domain-containing protein [Ramlibacter sp.]